MKSKEKNKYDWWFYHGDDPEALFKALQDVALRMQGTRCVRGVFVQVQNMMQARGHGHCSSNQISGTAMRFLGCVAGDMPVLIRQGTHVFENSTDGLSKMAEAYGGNCGETLYRFMYDVGAKESDDILVDTLVDHFDRKHGSYGYLRYSGVIGKYELIVFAAMAAAMIVCDEQSMELAIALDRLRRGLETVDADAKAALRREIEKTERKLGELKAKLKELNKGEQQ